MKLELGFIQISNIQISKECKVENGTLYVDPEAVKAFMYEDDDVKAWVKDFSFDVAKPGESVRITPVKDVIEPRVKVEGPSGEFPASSPRSTLSAAARPTSCAAWLLSPPVRSSVSRRASSICPARALTTRRSPS